jgi:hypothetical protein
MNLSRLRDFGVREFFGLLILFCRLLPVKSSTAFSSDVATVNALYREVEAGLDICKV